MAQTETAARRIYRTIFIRTRTGTKIHLGSSGGSGTHCGVRNMVHNARMMIRAHQVNVARVCESCGGVPAAERAIAESKMSDAELLAQEDADRATWAAAHPKAGPNV